MKNEREVLRREVFPIVQRICEERGVSFFEIDLRWGITKEEADGGQVLSICLEEIDRCRPFLLGIVGGRYGWIDPDAAAVIRRNERLLPLLPYANCSVTELELRYAVLNRPNGAPRPIALVYQRPAKTVENGELDGPRFGPVMSELRGLGVPVRSSSEDLQRFAGQVRSDLLDLIKPRLPARPPTPAERARFAARDLAIALGHRFVDLPSARKALALLRKWRRPRRIAIVGLAGSGKSMLAAALARALQRGDVPGTQVFAALRPAGWDNWRDAFQNLILQIQGIPGRNSASLVSTNGRSAIEEVLAAAAERRFTVAIIDGIYDRNISESAIPAWCPAPVANATIVVTLRGDAPLARALKASGWRVVVLGAVNRAEAQEFSEKFLAPHGRRLTPQQLTQLGSQERPALEVALMLEELRVVPRFEELPEAITRLGRVKEASELLGLVINRLERDYGGGP
jgi:preprotein translocase subunit SecA/nephrocystin-3